MEDIFLNKVVKDAFPELYENEQESTLLVRKAVLERYHEDQQATVALGLEKQFSSNEAYIFHYNVLQHAKHDVRHGFLMVELKQAKEEIMELQSIVNQQSAPKKKIAKKRSS